MTDSETYHEMGAEIERLEETTDRLQELGQEADLPAIERNAKRVEGVVETLADNVPSEILEK